MKMLSWKTTLIWKIFLNEDEDILDVATFLRSHPIRGGNDFTNPLKINMNIYLGQIGALTRVSRQTSRILL